MNADVHAGFGPAVATLGFVCDRQVSYKETDRATLIGMKLYDGAQKGKERRVRWVITENQSTKDGIPSQLRTLVLIERKDYEQFTAVVQIDTKVNFAARLLRMLRKNPEDDPIIFEPNPDVPKERKLRWAKEQSIDAANLEAVKLAKYQLMVYAKRNEENHQ